MLVVTEEQIPNDGNNGCYFPIYQGCLQEEDCYTFMCPFCNSETSQYEFSNDFKCIRCNKMLGYTGTLFYSFIERMNFFHKTNNKWNQSPPKEEV